MAKNNILEGFKVAREVNGGITPILNTNEVGSEAIFRYKGVVDEERDEYAVELYNAETKEFEKAIVRFRSQIISMIASDKISEGKLYYIKYKGKVRSKTGRPVCDFEVKELEG